MSFLPSRAQMVPVRWHTGENSARLRCLEIGEGFFKFVVRWRANRNQRDAPNQRRIFQCLIAASFTRSLARPR